jgi:ribosomal protein S18 acetylase RimI-like enzyme
MMTEMALTVRAATAADAATGLLYESSRPYYDAYAGDEGRALAILGAIYARRGHAASFEVCHVAVVALRVVGVLAAFPVTEGNRRARRFVTLTLPRLPPGRWPAVARHLRAAGTVAVIPPPGALYVDALAVDAGWRRRGVATALLERAESDAAAAGLEALSLETGLENDGAQALYAAHGFRRRSVRRAADERAAAAIGGAGFVGYVKRLR